MFVPKDPLGNPVDKRHPWNQTTIPRPQKRDFSGNYYLGHVAPLVRQTDRRPPGTRHRRRADRPVLVDRPGRHGRHRLHQGDRAEREDAACRRRPCCPKSNSNGRFPSGATRSNATGRAPTSRPTPPRCALLRRARPWQELHAGRTKTWTEFKVPDEAIGCGFHEAVRGVLSHHLVIRDKKIANYHPYPPTPWNASPRDSLRHARTLRRRRAGHADLRGKRPRQLQGHRHHACRAQLRSLPAVRRAHVFRTRQAAERSASRTDVRSRGPLKCHEVTSGATAS